MQILILTFKLKINEEKKLFKSEPEMIKTASSLKTIRGVLKDKGRDKGYILDGSKY